MTQWKGKSQSPLIGFKMYIFLLRNLGIDFCYFILRFVAFYFFLFVKQSRQSSYYFFRYRLKQAWITSYYNSLRTKYVFGQTLIDRVAIAIGMTKSYSFEFDGKHHIEQVLQAGEGGIFFTAHIGNFNVARFFFKEIESKSDVKMVVTDREHADIKAYFEAISVKASIDFIILKDDMSHAIPMSMAIKNKDVLIFATDRYLEGVATQSAQFFNEDVLFPEGPFKLALRYKLPVLFMHCMREPNRHYHLYARPLKQEATTVKALVEAYAQNVESMVRRYPLQWFNFYDYWNDRNRNCK